MLEPAVAKAGMSKTYLDAPYMGIHWDGRQVVVEFRGLAPSAEYRAGLEMGILAIEEQQSARLLLDCLKMRLVLVEDEQWLAKDFLPRLGRTRMKWMGLVTPENPLARLIVADLARPRPTGAQSKHCATVKEALEWLSHVEDQ